MTNPALIPDDWAELSPLVDQLLDAEPGARRALLVALGGNDRARYDSLAGLLAECERETTLLDRSAADVFDQLVDDDPPLVLAGRYALGREIGQGATARVYEAHDQATNRMVAVKLIRPGLAATLARDRFLREIAIATRLRHPNVTTLLDSGSEGDLLFLVMPIATVSLRSHLQLHGAAPIASAMPILRDVAAAIRYAHAEGVVHRDIKPDNVMLQDGVAMVTDFGISKAMLAGQSEDTGRAITQAGVVVGTPAYMAPEQWLGDPSANHRADLFSFGCLAFELLVGEPPFGRTDAANVTLERMRGSRTGLAAQLSEVAPPAVVEIILRCLAEDPGNRPANATQVVEALDPVARAHAPGIPFRIRALLGVALLVIVSLWYSLANR